MRKIKDLTYEDFPEIDPMKFNEWRDAQVRADKNAWIALGVMAGIVLLFLAVTGTLIVPGALVLVIVFYSIYSKPNRLLKEAGITRKMLSSARKNKPQNPNILQ